MSQKKSFNLLRNSLNPSPLTRTKEIMMKKLLLLNLSLLLSAQTAVASNQNEMILDCTGTAINHNDHEYKLSVSVIKKGYENYQVQIEQTDETENNYYPHIRNGEYNEDYMADNPAFNMYVRVKGAQIEMVRTVTGGFNYQKKSLVINRLNRSFSYDSSTRYGMINKKASLDFQCD